MIFVSEIPVPDSVRAKIEELLPGIRRKKLKGMICPAGGLSASLLSSGFLSDSEIVGFLDNDSKKHGTLIAGLPVHSVGSVESNAPDFVIVASLSFSKEIVKQLQPLSRRCHFKILDISIPDSNQHKTLPFINGCLEPVPEMVLPKLNNQLKSLKSRGSRVLLYSTHSLATSLWMRGVLAGINVVGVVDHTMPQGSVCHGLNVLHMESVSRAEADAIIVSDIGANLSALQGGLKIIQLCEGLNASDLRDSWSKYLEKIIWSNRLPDVPATKVQVWIHGYNLSDALCAISASRDFARLHPELDVQFQQLPEVLEAYNDNLVRHGNNGYVLPNQAGMFLAERERSIAGNYQGCYNLGLGMNFSTPPKPDLPALPPVEGLPPGTYVAVYPGVKGTDLIPSDEQIESLIHAIRLPILCIGDTATRRTIHGVDYSLLGSPLQSLRLIQHAAVVLTPRSAPAHISAAYDVPAIVWGSGNVYDWHIDYPSWNSQLVMPGGREFVDSVGGVLEDLLFARRGRLKSDSSARCRSYTPMINSQASLNNVACSSIEKDAQ